MMRVHRLLGALAVGALLQACGDDPESPPNRPPDLRMEDVVGCWNRDPVAGTCVLECFDLSGQQLFHEQDSSAEGNVTLVYEYAGTYSLEGWMIKMTSVAKTSASERVYPFEGSQPYRRVGPDLYTLTYDLQLGTRYTPVNLDSTLPCGTPFQLLPKPEGWTLF